MENLMRLIAFFGEERESKWDERRDADIAGQTSALIDRVVAS